MTQTVLPFKLDTTAVQLTAQGGLGLFGEFLHAMTLPQQVDAALPSPGSHKSYAPSAFVTPLLLMLQGGGRTLEDLRQIREDVGLRDLVRLRALPSADAMGDWLWRMRAGTRLATVNQALVRQALKSEKPTTYTLDLDVTQIVAEKRDIQWTYKGERGYRPMVGHFNFSACYTHNYREFMGGFTDWVENIADSGSAKQYRQKVTDAESSSMWQSLSFGANYKAAYCMAVCPAGEDVLSPFTSNRKKFVGEVVKPLQRKEEPIYVVPGSDAETYVAKRFPHKAIKHVGNSLRPRSIQGFLDGLPLVFQRKKSEGLSATYHFTFTGQKREEGTVLIKNQTVHVFKGHHGDANFCLTADSETWLGFLAKERNLFWALLTRNIRVKGSLKFFRAFARCFPS